MTLALGHRSVAEAQQCIDSREFAEWLAYDRISLIGAERGDWQAALAACVMANAFRAKGVLPFSLDDIRRWLPWTGRVAVRRDPVELEAQMMAWVKTIENMDFKPKE